MMTIAEFWTTISLLCFGDAKCHKYFVDCVEKTKKEMIMPNDNLAIKECVKKR